MASQAETRSDDIRFNEPQYFWAYIHTSTRAILTVKRLIHIGSIKHQDDLEYAIEEKKAGNDNIYIIIPNPILAMSYVDATKEGIKWLENHGFYRNNIGQWMYPEKDRWTNLELGSIVEGSEDPNEDQPASPTRRLELT